MKKLLLASALSILSTEAWAQCNGIFPPATLCGNLSASPAPAAPFPSSGSIVGPNSSVVGDVPIWSNVTGTQLGDSGVPITGVDSNVLATGAVITSAPTVSSAFCGKTAALGGSAFYAFTVGAASGFPANCIITVVNIDTGRGKKMAINGITFPNSSIVWPGQSSALRNINNVWTVTPTPGRWRPTTNTAVFVDKALGDDANDGLAAGAGGAWQNMQKGIDVLINIVDLHGLTYTANVAAGNYSENLWLGNYMGSRSSFGFGQVLFKATDATCANTKINPTSGVGIFATGGNPPYTFDGFQFESPGNVVNSVEMDSGGFVALKAACFGDTLGTHLQAIFSGSRIAMVASTFRVVGSGLFFMDAQHGGNIYFQGGSNITLVGTPTFTIWARSKNGADILTSGLTYTGSANAATQRYSVENNGNIDTEDNTSFPGGVSGKVYSGGVYNGLFTESKQGIANHPVLTSVGNPVLSACGAGPGFNSPSTDASGSFVTGAGAAGCTITFAVPWPNSLVPQCNVTAIDKASALVYAEGNTTLVLSSASANAGYRYKCFVTP